MWCHSPNAIAFVWESLLRAQIARWGNRLAERVLPKPARKDEDNVTNKRHHRTISCCKIMYQHPAPKTLFNIAKLLLHGKASNIITQPLSTSQNLHNTPSTIQTELDSSFPYSSRQSYIKRTAVRQATEFTYTYHFMLGLGAVDLSAVLLVPKIGKNKLQIFKCPSSISTIKQTL